MVNLTTALFNLSTNYSTAAHFDKLISSPLKVLFDRDYQFDGLGPLKSDRDKHQMYIDSKMC